jgi:HTH-type transcriptional regulator / antitoxin HigA
MSALAGSYAALLSAIRPEVIRDEKQNRAYIGRLEVLSSKKHLTSAEQKLMRLLLLLVEDFERNSDPVPDAGPIDVLRHLMEAHGLRQRDLTDVFGTESIVSEILHGKRDLTKEHIRRLSIRFSVSPAVFFSL